MCKKTKEQRDWQEKPFQFKLSNESLNRTAKHERVSVPCCCCGSVIALGVTGRIKNKKGNRIFCDIQCAGDYKRFQYKTDQYRKTIGYHERRQRKLFIWKGLIEVSWRCCLLCGRAYCCMKDSNKKFCSDRECRRECERVRHFSNYVCQSGLIVCRNCGKEVSVGKGLSRTKFCSHSCSKSESKRKRRHSMRLKYKESISFFEVFKAHKERCVKCGVKCNQRGGFNDPHEATIDHIVPVAKGGLHIRSNVQLMCRMCNSTKRDQVNTGTQLMLDLR